MPELTTDDVETFTRGRLSAGDAEVARMLKAALLAARRYCGWPVTPVVTDDTVVIDGLGSRMLNLPTRKVVELTSVTELGTALDLTKLSYSAGGPPGALSRPIVLRKRNDGFWKREYQSVTVVMTHGYTEDEAEDWRYAVLSMIDQMSQVLVSGRGELELLSKKVDDVTYRWGDPYANAANEAIYSVSGIFDMFALPSVEFV